MYVWECGINQSDVLEEIKKMNVKKASGFVKINTKCLKICPMDYVSAFSFLLNTCVEKCKFPSTWKTAIVVPILKQGNPKNIDNLRPIPLIPATGKVFERFINNFIIFHMESNDLLSLTAGRIS